MDDVPQEVVSQELSAADFVEEVPDLLVLEAASYLEWRQTSGNHLQTLIVVGLNMNKNRSSSI